MRMRRFPEIMRLETDPLLSVPADLVFDLDGTISDPIVGILRSFNFALESRGFEAVTEDVIARYVGPPLDEAFRSLVPRADEALVRDLVAKYRERYSDVGYSENTLYAGIPEALHVLSAAKQTLGICTSKRSDFAERILTLFDLRDHFAFVDGGDVGIRKEQQLAALLAAGSVHAASRMIGDRAIDIAAARSNELNAVGVLWGYGSESELRDAGADLLIDTPAALPGRLLGG